MKKFLSLLLCLSLVLSLGALPVLASEDAPDEAAPAVSEEVGEEPAPESAIPAEDALPPAADGDPAQEVSSATPTDAYDESGNLITAGTIPGTAVIWSYADDMLTIAGSGAMPDFAYGSENNHVPWYAWKDKIQKIVVSPGVTRVGAYTAEQCLRLTELELAEGITELGDYAFSGCSGLTEVRLPSTLVRIGNGCFSGCAGFDAGLSSINLPSGLKYIGSNAFEHDLIADAALPEGLEYIGAYAFFGTLLRETAIPGTVAEIGRGAFSTCMSLRSVALGDGVTALPEYCFDGCARLSLLELPGTIVSVGYRAVAGTAVSSLVLPDDEDYEFAGWIDENGTFFSGSEIASGAEYTGDLTASWLRSWVEGRFTDVKESAWYHDAVQFCYQAQLMNGMSETVFDPNGSATRGQVVTVLWRLAGEPSAQDSDFSDVSGGKYYSDAVAWAAHYGITTGYPDGTFRPNNAVTRQEFLTFLFRFTEAWAGEQPSSCDLDPLADFVDRDQVGSWAQSAECWSVAAGLQEGSLENGVLRLNPMQSIRRSELAAFLMRYCIAIVSAESETTS